MSISEKSLHWREMLAEGLSWTTVAVAPVREKSQLDYAHLITPEGVGIEIVYNQTMKLPATDARPNELEWTEEGWAVIYKGADCDTSTRTIYIHPEKNWTDKILLHEIVGAVLFVSE